MGRASTPTGAAGQGPGAAPGASGPADLRRSLGLVQATAIVVGIIIGASIFVQPSEIVRDVPTVRGIFLVWTVAGLLTAAGALICAELSSAWPETGGVYVFLRRSVGPLVAFLWGWAMFWVMHTGIIAAIAMVFGRYAATLLPGGDAWIRPLALMAILLVSAVNYAGVQHGGRLQAAFTIVKVGAIALMIAAAFALGARQAPPVFETGVPSDGSSPVGFLRAVAAGLFAFGGWHMVTYTAGETVDARRTVPRALVIGILIVVVSYIALNAAYLHVLPLPVVMASSRVAADAADAVLGAGGATFMAILVAFSAFGALAGLVLAGPRVYHSMAADGTLFRWLGAVHSRHRTPHRAIALQALWACVLVMTGTYRALFTRVVYTEWIFFALMAAGLLLARRTSAFRPAWSVPGGPAIPLLFILGSAGVVLNQVLVGPVESAIGLGIVLLGVPVHRLWARSSERRETHAHH